MRQVLRLFAVLVVAVAAIMACAGAASADGAFVGQGCLLGPPENPAEGHGGVVITSNGTAVTHCVVPGESSASGLPLTECFLYTAGQGEIVVYKTTPNGTVVLICSNAQGG